MSDLLHFLHDVFWHWQSWLGGTGFGGAVVVLLGLYERLSGHTMGKRMYVTIFIIAFLFGAFFLAWRDQYKRANTAEARVAADKPDFIIDVPHITAYTNAKHPDFPVVLLLTIEIINRGHDSIARHWKGHFKSGAIERDLLIEAITDTPLTVRHGTVEQVIRSENAIYNKTKFLISRGSMADGVLVVHPSVEEWAQVVSQKASLTVMVEDYLGNKYSSADIKPIKADGFLPYPGVEIHTQQKASSLFNESAPIKDKDHSTPSAGSGHGIRLGIQLLSDGRDKSPVTGAMFILQNMGDEGDPTVVAG